MILKWWRKRMRKTDLAILWPSCTENAPDLDHAKAAFACHVYHDRAWTKDFTSQELFDFIDKLKAGERNGPEARPQQDPTEGS